MSDSNTDPKKTTQAVSSNPATQTSRIDVPPDSMPKKDAVHVWIDELRKSNGTVEFDDEKRRMKLSEKIDEYLFKLGYSNAQIIGILIQLLTDGKIRVDFSQYIERLELVNHDDIMSRTEALMLFEAYLYKEKGVTPEPNIKKLSATTQKIMIQIPGYLKQKPPGT